MSGQQAAEEAVEIAAVQAALKNHIDSPAPENMFCPFVVMERDEKGHLTRQLQPMMHWGNVDTGSMVNIVYSGVLRNFPHLHQYHKKFEHVVKGVGDNLTKVVGKLVNVPISLGMEQAPGTCSKVTFYVLQCDTYHFILGLDLLAKIDGGVFCGSRRLEYTLGPEGGHQKCSIPLATRTLARSYPCYHVHSQYVDITTPPPPYASLASIPEGWAPHYLDEEARGYVQEALVDVAAWAATNNESTQYQDHLLPPCYTTMLDCSQPQPLNMAAEAVEPAPTPASPPAPSAAEPPILVEEALALAHLAAEVPRPGVEGHCTLSEALPRHLRKQYAKAATCHTHVEFLTGVNSRGYG